MERMRELTYYVAVSIDGFIAAPDGDFSAFPVEGDHMAHLVTEYADAVPSHVQRAVGIESDNSRFDTVIMGWNTYLPALDEGITSPYAHLKQVVASRSAREVDPAIELTADPVATVRRLKEQPGTGIYLAGGGELAGVLIDEIDRLVLKLNPLMLGQGIPLFARVPNAVRRFQRTAVRAFDSGVTLLEFERG